MGNFVRAYLRASTDEQDPARAKQALQDFADKHGLLIAKFYVEQASGNKLNRPKLNELLDDCTNGDILLLESIDRLSRLNQSDWQTLKNRLQALSLRLIVLDLPITHQTAQNGSEWLYRAFSEMFIELYAHFAYTDYQTRKERQKQGIAKARAKGKYKGRQADTEQYKRIVKLIESSLSYRETAKAIGCSLGKVQNAVNWYGGVDKNQQRLFGKGLK